MATRGEKTRKKILDAALVLFIRQGIDKTGTAEITDRIGVAEGTLFVHYKNKQELVNTLYLLIKEDEAKYLAKIDIDIKNPEEAMKTFIAALCEYYLRRYKQYQYVNLIELGYNVDRKIIVEANEYRDLMFERIRRWQMEGAIKSIDEEFLFEILWDMSRAMIHRAHQEKQKTITDPILDIAWDAVRKVP